MQQPAPERPPSAQTGSRPSSRWRLTASAPAIIMRTARSLQRAAPEPLRRAAQVPHRRGGPCGHPAGAPPDPQIGRGRHRGQPAPPGPARAADVSDGARASAPTLNPHARPARRAQGRPRGLLSGTCACGGHALQCVHEPPIHTCLHVFTPRSGMRYLPDFSTAFSHLLIHPGALIVIDQVGSALAASLPRSGGSILF